MKKNLFMIVTILTITTNCNAQWVNRGFYTQVASAFVSFDSNIFTSITGSGVYHYAPKKTGIPWIQSDSALNDKASVDCFATFKQYLFAGTSSGGLWRRVSNGTLWSGIEVLHVRALVSNGNAIFAGGYGISRSKDSGKSWTTVFTANVHAIVTIGDTILAGAEAGVVRSTNNGDSWTTVSPNLGVVTFVVIDSAVFMSSNTLYRSSDYGLTWTPMVTNMKYPDITHLATDGKNLFAGTSQEGVWTSTDLGGSWTDVNQGLTDYITKSLAVCDTFLCASFEYYDLTMGTGVWMRPLSQMVPPKSGVQEVAALPVRDTLEIYPNPASGLVTIRFAGGTAISWVSVLNVLGEAVLEFPSPRASELTLDLSHFASGTYFLRIETAKGIVMRKVVRE